MFTLPDTDLGSNFKPDGYIVLYRTCSHFRDSNSDPYFFVLQESESESVFGKVNEPLMIQMFFCYTCKGEWFKTDFLDSRNRIWAQWQCWRRWEQKHGDNPQRLPSVDHEPSVSVPFHSRSNYWQNYHIVDYYFKCKKLLLLDLAFLTLDTKQYYFVL